MDDELDRTQFGAPGVPPADPAACPKCGIPGGHSAWCVDHPAWVAQVRKAS